MRVTCGVRSWAGVRDVVRKNQRAEDLELPAKKDLLRCGIPLMRYLLTYSERPLDKDPQPFSISSDNTPFNSRRTFDPQEIVVREGYSSPIRAARLSWPNLASSDSGLYDPRQIQIEYDIGANPRLFVNRWDRDLIEWKKNKLVECRCCDPVAPFTHHLLPCKDMSPVLRKWHRTRAVWLPAHHTVAYWNRLNLLRILEAIRNKDLSSLSPRMLDDRILPKIATNSLLLTDQQLSCLEVSNRDFIGLDGIVDYVNEPGTDTVDASSFLPSVAHCHNGICYISYMVTSIGILRKEKLIPQKISSSNGKFDPKSKFDPYKVDLSSMRVLFVRIEYAQQMNPPLYMERPDETEISQYPKIVNFQIHSF